MSQLAETFIATLQQFERDRDLDCMVARFDDTSELSRAPRRASYRGKDGARAFWSEYLDAFQKIETKFERVIESDGKVALEWRSVATTKQGTSIEYNGCTVLEGRDETVARFRTYYDAASAGMGGAPRAER